MPAAAALRVGARDPQQAAAPARTAMTAQPGQEGRAAWTALVLTAVLWAGQAVAAKSVAGDVPPATFSFWRWVATFAVVLPLAWRELVRERASIRANWRMLLLLGLLSTTPQNTVFYWGIRHSTATNASLLNSTIPIWILIISSLFFHRRSSHGEWLGVAVSLAGVVMIVLGGSRGALGQLAFNPGDILLATAMINWSVYSVLVPRRPVHLSSWAYLSVISVVGLVAIVPVMLLEGAIGMPTQLNAVVVAGWLYIAIPGTIITTMTYNYAIDKLGAAKAGLGVHMVPVFGMLLAFVLLGERPTWLAVAGFLLVLAGIGVAHTARR